MRRFTARWGCVILLAFTALTGSPCLGYGRLNNVVLRSLTLEEKVGQLFVIRPEQLTSDWPLDGRKYDLPGDKRLSDEMRERLRQYPAGGFVLFKTSIETPEQLTAFTRELRGACAVPPILAIDEEGGRVARIANHGGFGVPKFESMEAIGRTEEPRNAYKAGNTIGRYLKEYGFTMDFAPVADINTNPENIVIGNRSFGSDPARVSGMVGAYLDGLHTWGVAGSVKHFPGHGDSRNDTHSGYVAVYKTWDELLKAEIIPFRDNIAKADSIMVAHITLENATGDGLPATLSRELITGKLRKELGYDGVILTDALKMDAITKTYSPAEAALLAFEAGNDILLMPQDYCGAFDGVLRAVKEGRISEERLDESVRRILRLKGIF